jgi:hypothetical protein
MQLSGVTEEGGVVSGCWWLVVRVRTAAALPVVLNLSESPVLFMVRYACET